MAELSETPQRHYGEDFQITSQYMTWFFRTGFLRGWMKTNIWREEEGEANSEDEKEPEKK
jgi:hypothetical protein